CHPRMRFGIRDTPLIIAVSAVAAITTPTKTTKITGCPGTSLRRGSWSRATGIATKKPRRQSATVIATATSNNPTVVTIIYFQPSVRFKVTRPPRSEEQGPNSYLKVLPWEPRESSPPATDGG